ncbi:hypothetical protein SAMN05421594_1584 [Chryseobacterium oleae]|uniref:Uncharacterized protein n=1 Tax=Chryseobacterium oleae TaxID=491207 RepID=A0A1I4X8R1_CHROL|nr:hypothetical protein SAMN05421594_1584 [Chryseobacterium oleae]
MAQVFFNSNALRRKDFISDKIEYRCHCEEHSDEAISEKYLPQMTQIFHYVKDLNCGKIFKSLNSSIFK